MENCRSYPCYNSLGPSVPFSATCAPQYVPYPLIPPEPPPPYTLCVPYSLIPSVPPTPYASRSPIRPSVPHTSYRPLCAPYPLRPSMPLCLTPLCAPYPYIGAGQFYMPGFAWQLAKNYDGYST